MHPVVFIPDNVSSCKVAPTDIVTFPTPILRPTLYVKFPTTDENKGFGTGKLDFGAGVALSKWLGNWQPFAEGRYIVQGASHDETGAVNFVTADTEVAYSWNDHLVTSGYVRYGSKFLTTWLLLLKHA